MYTIGNDIITVGVNDKGAELASLKKNGVEYLWNGDPKYWGRTAPILFPFVGAVNNGVYRYDDKEYKMGQHGFARDMVFEMLGKTEESISFKLTDTEETYEKYPFHFHLYIMYKIEGNKLTVGWSVENTDDKVLYFSIGGHPAFMCPLDGNGKQTDYSLLFKKSGKRIEKIKAGLLEGGLFSKKREFFDAPNGLLKITEHMFDDDALILEGSQVNSVSLVDPDGNEYVKVKFSTPIMGIWSPAGKNAPFVCIEPWYGRCDKVGFDSDLEHREYSHFLMPGNRFDGGFTIEI